MLYTRRCVIQDLLSKVVGCRPLHRLFSPSLHCVSQAEERCAGDILGSDLMLITQKAETLCASAKPIHDQTTVHHCITKAFSKMLHINHEKIKGENQIHEVCSAGNVSHLKRLIESGVGVNVRDSDGRTPLHKAARADRVEVIRCLMGHGADPNSRTEGSGEPVLHYAIVRSSDETVETLVSTGCSLNLRSRSGESPIHVAIAENRFKTVQLLCEKGANLRIINRSGLTVVQFALLLRKWDILHYLIQINALLEDFSSSRETLLLMAARLDFTEGFEVIGQLLKSGYDVINDPWIWNNNASVFSGDTGRDLRTFLQTRAAEVPPLRHLVCYKIRKCIGICLPYKISSLPVPRMMKGFLKLSIINTAE